MYTADKGKSRTRGVCLFKISSASKVANPNHVRYFEMWTNQPDSRPNAQICLLVSLVALQIPHPASPRSSVSEKAAGDSRAVIAKTQGKPLRQVPHRNPDRSVRLLEGSTSHRPARNRHSLASAELQIVLEMEEQTTSGPTEDPSGADRSHQADGKRQPSLRSSADSRRDVETRN
jgi:hypothetical protein